MKSILQSTSKISNAIKAGWLIVVIFGTGYYFFRNRFTVISLIQHVSLIRILTSFALLTLGQLFLVFLIRFSVETEGWYPGMWEVIGLYGSTTLGKYLPGGIWHFVGRFGVYRSKGLDNKQISRVFILENIWLASSAAVVGLVAILLYRPELFVDFFSFPISRTVAILLSFFVCLIWIAALNIIHRYFQKFSSRPIRSVWLIALSGISLWILAGLSFFVIFPNNGLNVIGLFVGGYAISWVVGYFAVFAPGGVGIRETMLVLIFASIGSAEQISVYAAMNRIIWVIAELLFGLAGYLQKPKQKLEDLEGQSITNRSE